MRRQIARFDTLVHLPFAPRESSVVSVGPRVTATGACVIEAKDQSVQINEIRMRFKSLGGISRPLVSFVTTHRTAISLMSVLLGVFVWTNWYFSPRKQLERLAEEMAQSAKSEISSDDVARMMDFLHINFGGSMSVYSSCPTHICEVTVSHFYLTGVSDPQQPKKTWQLEVKTTLKPFFSDPGALGFLPHRIEWTELGWRWDVRIIDSEDLRKRVSYSGTLAQINQAPTIEGSNTIASILNSMAVGMRKELRR